MPQSVQLDSSSDHYNFQNTELRQMPDPGNRPSRSVDVSMKAEWIDGKHMMPPKVTIHNVSDRGTKQELWGRPAEDYLARYPELDPRPSKARPSREDVQQMRGEMSEAEAELVHSTHNVAVSTNLQPATSNSHNGRAQVVTKQPAPIVAMTTDIAAQSNKSRLRGGGGEECCDACCVCCELCNMCYMDDLCCPCCYG